MTHSDLGNGHHTEHTSEVVAEQLCRSRSERATGYEVMGDGGGAGARTRISRAVKTVLFPLSYAPAITCACTASLGGRGIRPNTRVALVLNAEQAA